MVHRILPTFALAFVLVTCLRAAKPVFQKGKLLDVTTETRLVDGSSYQWAVFVVQIDDLVYTLRGSRLGRVHASLITLAITKSGDSGRDLIVGDPVDVSIHGEDMTIRKPNGKDLKTKIIKRARAQ
jgi:hypothetical protein